MSTRDKNNKYLFATDRKKLNFQKIKSMLKENPFLEVIHHHAHKIRKNKRTGILENIELNSKKNMQRF